jgi:hypothetical protein
MCPTPGFNARVLWEVHALPGGHGAPPRALDDVARAGVADSLARSRARRRPLASLCGLGRPRRLPRAVLEHFPESLAATR